MAFTSTAPCRRLRRHSDIPAFRERRTPTATSTIRQAAVALGVAPSTLHRLLNDGVIAGEQTPPALRGAFV